MTTHMFKISSNVSFDQQGFLSRNLTGCTVSPFFLAGGWKRINVTDPCTLEVAKESVAQLSSTIEFQSRFDSDCLMKLQELQSAESQVK